MIAALTGDDVRSLRHCVEVALRSYHALTRVLRNDFGWDALPGTQGSRLKQTLADRIETAERLLVLLDDLGEEK